MASTLAALLGAVLLAVLLWSIVLWSSAIPKLLRGGRLLALEPRRPVPWGLVDLLLIFLLVVFLLQGAQFLVIRVFDIPAGTKLPDMAAGDLALMLLAGSLSLLAGSGIALLLVMLRASATWSDIGFRADALLADVRIGAGAFVMLAPPVYLLQMGLTRFWPSEHPVQTLLMKNQDVGMLLTTLLTAVVVAPLSEEIFFRTLLQGWLENASLLLRKVLRRFTSPPWEDPAEDDLDRDFRALMIGDPTGQSLHPVEAAAAKPLDQSLDDREQPSNASAAPEAPTDNANPYASPRADSMEPLGGEEAAPKNASPEAGVRPARWPMFVSAAVFALLHWGHGPDPIPLFFLAVGMGYVYYRTHRLLPCIVLHFLVNSTSMAALWIYLLQGET